MWKVQYMRKYAHAHTLSFSLSLYVYKLALVQHARKLFIASTRAYIRIKINNILQQWNVFENHNTKQSRYLQSKHLLNVQYTNGAQRIIFIVYIVYTLVQFWQLIYLFIYVTIILIYDRNLRLPYSERYDSFYLYTIYWQ